MPAVAAWVTVTVVPTTLLTQAWGEAAAAEALWLTTQQLFALSGAWGIVMLSEVAAVVVNHPEPVKVCNDT